MFYEPRKKNHGLPHDPYNAIVGPRPIGWITSVNLKGDINLAPYSYFNSVSTDPPMVMLASDGRKDTIEFVEETGEFVCNLAVWDLRAHVKDTSLTFARGINEMEVVGLEATPSVLVKPPRVKLHHARWNVSGCKRSSSKISTAFPPHGSLHSVK